MGKKKSFWAILLFFILLGLAGCGETETDKTNYTISWEVNGEVIKTDTNVEEGTVPQFVGNTPTKDDEQFYYTFIGWMPEVSAATKNQKYTAVFEQGELKEYSITWKDADGSILEVTTVAYGTLPARSLPSDTSQWEYTGWSPQLSITTENTTYTANRMLKEFLMTWKDSDGTVLGTTTVKYGETPTKTLPTDTNQWSYQGWSPQPSAVTSNQSYTAVRTVKEYLITWVDGNNDILETRMVKYGEIPTKTLPADTNQWTYEEWTPQPKEVTANVTYKATGALKEYLITWNNADGSLLGTTAVKYGQQPSKVLPNDTDQWEYYGWSPEIVVVTGEATYSALRKIKQYSITFTTDDVTNPEITIKDYGSIVAKPNNPKKEGYRFVAWCIDEDLKTPVDWPITLTSDIVLYASWNEEVPYSAYLQALLGSYRLNPNSFIPEAMLPENHLIDEGLLINNFSNFTAVNSITYGGFGEQWQMVVDNLNQSKMFFNVLSVIDSLTATSISAFNNYLDSNPEDAASYEFLSGIYQVTIKVDNQVIYYVLDYTATLPLFGQQTIQIMLSYNIHSLEKTGRIQIGDANALKYVSSEDHYEFAIKYLGVRNAFFKVNRDENGRLEGSIFEYLGVDGVFTTASSAQFFIEEDYTTVVGNKASGMLGWEGTINELYLTDIGELIGYEVREIFSVITFNTLWFNLGDTTGITSIKLEKAPIENQNPYYVYINNDEQVFVAKKVGGINVKTSSRRFDIELRKQYFYTKVDNEIVAIEVEIPMLFVQQEQLNDLENDVRTSNSNSIVSFSLDVSTSLINKIIADYEAFIDEFINQKEEISIEYITTFIGDPIEFDE